MKLSIIIPTSSRAHQLRFALNSICSMDLENVNEIIVIENGNKDSTQDVVNNLVRRTSIDKLKYHYSDTPGLLSGRHLGTELATGDILCFLDDDIEVNNHYASNVHKCFSNNPQLQLATGPCLPKYEVEPPVWLPFMWTQIPEGKFCTWLSLLDFGNREISIDPNFVWGLNFCIRKQALMELGGFHPDCVPDELQKYQGDGETGLTSKASKQQIKAIYAPGLQVFHQIGKERLTIKYFNKRAYYLGVANSYTQCRNLNRNDLVHKKSIALQLKELLLPTYLWIRKLTSQESKVAIPEQAQKLLSDLRKSENEGFLFHQAHFKSDEGVREWVLKENYWDFRYPAAY